MLAVIPSATAVYLPPRSLIVSALLLFCLVLYPSPFVFYDSSPYHCLCFSFLFPALRNNSHLDIENIQNGALEDDCQGVQSFF